jgi:Ca-activated chloride channel homolog
MIQLRQGSIGQAHLRQGYGGQARMRAFLVLVAMLLSATISARQDAPSGGLTIISPPDGAYISGQVLLQARMTSGPAPRQVTFFADGRSICTLVVPPFDCPWDAGAALKEHVIRVTATLANGQRLVATARTKSAGYTETVDVDVVQVTTTVTDANGLFVQGLTRDKFKVREDGVLQRVTAFAGENIPLEVVVAVDVSESMTDAMPTLKAAVKGFLGALRPTDQVSLLAFNDNIFTLARRSSDQEVRAKAVERLAPWGGTALYDVIIRAADLLGRQSGRRAMVVFTDGDDQSSHASMPAVVQRAEASDATIYMIGEGRAIEARNLQQLMRQLASVSGGRAFFSEQPSKLVAIFEEILEDLRHQYLLAYAPPEGARDGEWHRLRVEVPGHQYSVRARQGYRMTRRNPQ